MKLLVIGNGGREHVLAEKLNQSKKVQTVFCAPGNAGMKKSGIHVVKIAQDDHEGLIDFAKKQHIDWTIIGPEVPLFNGLADDFEKHGLTVFGPSRAATMIEASKGFAKRVMDEQQIPTAAYEVFDEYEKAAAYLSKKGAPIVIKADGLAAGKGVVVAETLTQAQQALKDRMQKDKFGLSAAQVVIEDCLRGEEFSLMAFVKGDKVYPMPIAQDHKRLLEGDKGPNTGGMGAYSPVPHISADVVKEAIEKILKPAAVGLTKEGTPFTGILYAGIIVTEEGPKAIEFNARFGDPETQVVLNRLESDLAEAITAILNNEEPDLKWKKTGVDLGVVVAAKGYPEQYEKNILLESLDLQEESLYYAGVKEAEDDFYSDGGRIYLVEAFGETVQQAQDVVYQVLNQIKNEQLVYRKDIGDKAWKSAN